MFDGAKAEDTTRICLKPRTTGLPWFVWLFRESPEMEIWIEFTEDAAYYPNEAVQVVLEPIFLVRSGPPVSEDISMVMERWAQANRDAIDGYWYRSLATENDVVHALKPIRLTRTTWSDS